jgi:hypothetical protein
METVNKQDKRVKIHQQDGLITNAFLKKGEGVYTSEAFLKMYETAYTELPALDAPSHEFMHILRTYLTDYTYYIMVADTYFDPATRPHEHALHYYLNNAPDWWFGLEPKIKITLDQHGTGYTLWQGALPTPEGRVIKIIEPTCHVLGGSKIWFISKEHKD